MRNPLFIGIDSSTTATKAIAWDLEGKPVAQARSRVAVSSPSPGFAEQDANDWWTSARRALRACTRKIDADRVAAVGITVQRETFVLLDSQLQPLRPAILWYDARAAEGLPALGRRLGVRRYHRATGKQLDVTSAIAKLGWLGRHEPGLRQRTALFCDVLAFLACRLTGSPATTPSGVDTTGLIDLQTMGWYAPHVRAAGLSDNQLPALVPAGAPLGYVTDAAAKATGLPPGIPVVAGGGDGHCFSLGAGRMRKQCATLTLGTSAVLGFTTPRPVLGPEFRTLIACEPGGHVLESVIQCGSATVSWMHETFLPGSSSTTSLRRIEKAAAKLPPGAGGLIALPHWRGLRVPEHDPAARGVVAGWTDRHTAAHLHRAIMEGIALEAGNLLALISTRYELPVRRLVVGGGGAASDLWCRILADVTGVPCSRPSTVETASLGAAMLAAAFVTSRNLRQLMRQTDRSEEVFRPINPHHLTYTRLARLHRDLRSGTKHVSRELTRIFADQARETGRPPGERT